jgi:hypothetical protein
MRRKTGAHPIKAEGSEQMKETTLTPEKVKTIEAALEERKTPADRRKRTDPAYAGPERRSGRDRRNPADAH